MPLDYAGRAIYLDPLNSFAPSHLRRYSIRDVDIWCRNVLSFALSINGSILFREVSVVLNNRSAFVTLKPAATDKSSTL